MDKRTWIDTLREIIDIAQVVTTDLSRKSRRHTEARFFNVFVLQAKHGLEAVTLLYASNLNEPAQVMVRALLECQINFDIFLPSFFRDPRDTMRRMLDAMMLEKIKQVEQTKFRGFDLPDAERLRQTGERIAANYPPDEVKAMRRHGFSGIPVVERAKQTGHLDAYNVVYRNFSRNVHGSDYAEYFQRDLKLPLTPQDAWAASRDGTALSTSVFCGIGILEPTARVFRCPVVRRIGAVKMRMRQLSQ